MTYRYFRSKTDAVSTDDGSIDVRYARVFITKKEAERTAGYWWYRDRWQVVSYEQAIKNSKDVTDHYIKLLWSGNSVKG